jgi:hypothetical protein
MTPNELFWRSVHAVRRIDPAPNSPPLGVAFGSCFVGLVLLTTWLLVVNRYLPGTDTPYHAFCSRVWLEAGKPGTPYAGYEPRHLLDANTFLYDVVGVLAVVLKPFTAYRLATAYYFIGLPLACLYALRAFGRSPWGSLLAFPLCYGESFASGFINFEFAAPTFVLALVLHARLCERPTLRRGAAVALLFLAVFLSHAHVYLWLGVLVIPITIAHVVRRIGLAAFREAAVVIVASLAAAAPSLLVFRSWYSRTYGQGHVIAGADTKLSDAMTTLPLSQKFTGGILQTFSATHHPSEAHFVLALGALAVLAMGLQRAEGDRKTSLPELALLATALSYYVLPDSIAGQMVAPRQWYIVAWLVPLVVLPVAPKVSLARWMAVTGGILLWTGFRMWVVADYLDKYTKNEMVGLAHLIRTAPNEPGLRIAYAGVDPNSETWNTSHGHSYAFVAAERSYDGPLEPSDKNSVAAVRYHEGPPLPIKHVYNNPTWYADAEIWRYDVILVRRWKPSHEDKAAALEHGDLVAAGGDWELWRAKRVVQTATP